MTACLNCGLDTTARHKRGLCWRCYRSNARHAYPRQCNRGVGAECNGGYQLPPVPTVAVLERRRGRGAVAPVRRAGGFMPIIETTIQTLAYSLRCDRPGCGVESVPDVNSDLARRVQ